jgi:hypothetical protein
MREMFDLNVCYIVMRCSTLCLAPYSISHIVSLYQTVLRAGIFDIHGVLSTNVDNKKKGCIDPFPLSLLLSYVVFCLCSILFCSILFCSVTSCLVLCHAVLTRNALFLRFTVPYSMPFYAMRHCGVSVTLHNAPSILFYVYFVPKPYVIVVFLYIH